MRLGGGAPHELHQHEAEEVARDVAEGVRLAYVAATRARDLLVVPALGDEPWDGGWLNPLNRALYPPIATRRTATRGPKCPPFKSKDSVLLRPNDEVAGPSTVCPGRHAFADAGGYSVVWWDPTALRLGAEAPFGVRREDLIVKDVPKHVIADGRTQYDAWQLARHDARARGASASVSVQTVNEWVTTVESVRGRQEGQESVSIVNLGAGGVRPGGLDFGAPVHEIMAQAPSDAPPDTFANTSDMYGQLLRMT